MDRDWPKSGKVLLYMKSLIHADRVASLSKKKSPMLPDENETSSCYILVLEGCAKSVTR